MYQYFLFKTFEKSIVGMEVPQSSTTNEGLNLIIKQKNKQNRKKS